MSMDAIKQVQDSEALARQAKAQAQTEAQAILAQAKRDAEELLAQAKRETQAQVRELLDRAQAQAEEESRNTLADFDAQCGELKAAAEKKLDDASSLIVRRVVSS